MIQTCLPAEPAFPCSDDNNSQQQQERIWIVEHPARRPPPGRRIWDVDYIGIQLFSAKMMFDNPNPLLAGWLLLLAGCCCRRYTGKPASCAGCELCGHDYCGGGPALPAFSTDAHPLQKASVLSRVSRSTRFAFFRTAPNSKFSNFRQYFSNFLTIFDNYPRENV